MIKTIQVSQIRIGMYVSNLGCSWLDHPFMSGRFKVSTAKEIEDIVRLGVEQVRIDTDKGLDVAASDQPGPTPGDAESPGDPAAGQVPTDEPANTCSVEDELTRAAQVMVEANQVVTRLMEDARLGKQVEIERVHPVVESIVASLFRNQNALLGLIRLRRVDKYTFEHAVSVAILLTTFGKHLGMDEEDLVQIGIGGLLLDVGKCRVPSAILTKRSTLNDNELEIVHRHVQYGREILAEVAGISEIAELIVAEHHERYNGTGYPSGKRGDQISLYGQMAAIVDVYDALVTERVYRHGMSPHEALKQLVAWRRTHFSADLVYSFIHCLGVYPIGTLVELSDGRFAVVLEAGAKGPLLPRVRVVFDGLRRRFVTPEDLDLAHQRTEKPVSIIGAQDAVKWRIRPETYLDQARLY